jgi:hypothetical protein
MTAARRRAPVVDPDVLDDLDVDARVRRGELVRFVMSTTLPDPVRLAELRTQVSARRSTRRAPRKK